MEHRTKHINLWVISALILAIAAGMVAFAPWDQGQTNPIAAQPVGGRLPVQTSAEDLDNALGISVETLQIAEKSAMQEALKQAVEKGLLTQEQAEAMLQNTSNAPMLKDFGGQGFANASSGINYDELLAGQLSISTSELQAARQKARQTALETAVSNGTITQDQLDQIQAEEKLQTYLDPNNLLAEALRISSNQLKAYQDDGLSTNQILAKLGKTASEVYVARAVAVENALQQAVTDNLISQDQANTYLLRHLDGAGMGQGGPGGMGNPDANGAPSTPSVSNGN